ncbi:MAG: aquaporin Z [Ignavibacteriae bacterium]|nr:aquaporin Z [Ignavibacteriota bacterium]
METKPFTKYVAELIGTMVLVLIGCGSAVIAGINIGFLGISFAFGIAVLVMVYTIGPISGCHINPAISISMFIIGKLNAKDTAFYVLFQIIGGIIGAGILYLIAIGVEGYAVTSYGLGQNGYGLHSPGKYSLVSGLIAEVVFTAIFLFVILGSTHKNAPSGFAGIAIGFTLFLIHIVMIPITGTSVNPARSIGPALFVGGVALEQLWVFIVAPIVGGIIGALVWKMLFGKE